jgi:hypothetical protein
MLLRTLIAMTLMIGMAGCTPLSWQRMSAGTSQPPLDVYVHRVATEHVVLHWNCTRPARGVLRLEGIASSPWGPWEVSSLELELVGLNAQGRVVTQAEGPTGSLAKLRYDGSPFHIDLQTDETEVRLDLYYQYRFDNQSPAPNRYLARDVCSES